MVKHFFPHLTRTNKIVSASNEMLITSDSYVEKHILIGPSSNSGFLSPFQLLIQYIFKKNIYIHEALKSILIFSTVMILNSEWITPTIQTNLIIFIYNLRIKGQIGNVFSLSNRKKM